MNGLNEENTLKAEIFDGEITYFYEKMQSHLRFHCYCVVVGHPVGEGCEKKQSHYQSTRNAARLCGYAMSWLPFVGGEGDRKLFITGPRKKDGTLESLDPVTALKIVDLINKLTDIAITAPNQYKKFDVIESGAVVVKELNS